MWTWPWLSNSSKLQFFPLYLIWKYKWVNKIAFCIGFQLERGFETTASHAGRQIYKGDPRTCAILISAWDSNWGYSDFSRNQNNHGSSGAYITSIYYGLSVKITRVEMQHSAQRSSRHLFCILFLCVWWAKKTWRSPIWAPWLTTPLHRVVYQVWDLPCISVCWPQL